MINPLYQSMMNSNAGNITQAIERLKKQYPGNPNDYIQQLLNSGRVTQSQYNRAVQQAQQIQQLMGMK